MIEAEPRGYTKGAEFFTRLDFQLGEEASAILGQHGLSLLFMRGCATVTHAPAGLLDQGARPAAHRAGQPDFFVGEEAREAMNM